MKSFIVLAVLVAAALAVPVDQRNANIVRQDVDNIGVGPYSYAYETENGIKQQEQGQLKNEGTDNEALEVRGSYSYVGDDGQQYVVNYVANEFGFQPDAAHIPRA